jgi:hypothetical protein
MSTATARRIVTALTLVMIELLMMAIIPGWWGVIAAWTLTGIAGVFWNRGRIARWRRGSKRPGPRAEWID